MKYFKIAVDCVILGYDNRSNQLKILFTKRVNHPNKNQWALPGGFVTETESFEETAKAILKRETGVHNIYLRQLRAYSLTDPSEENRIASIAYFSLVKFDDLVVAEASQSWKWFHFRDYPELPFDHGKKVKHAIERVKQLVRIEPVVFNLLPIKFPLNQLQKVYEELYEKKLDNRNFRKRIKKLNYIEASNEFEKNVSHRPGLLYQFNMKKYNSGIEVY
ncbi:MAG: NUDIX domain-containing protein [Bacteroidota bacterium]